MNRFSSLMLVAAATAILAGCVETPPRGSASLGSNVLGLKQGDTWTYRNFEVPSGRLNRTWTENISATSESGVWLARVDQLAPNNRRVVQATEFLRFGDGFLNQPLFVGKRWSSHLSINGEPIGTASYRVLRQEKVKVAAGEFDAFVIEGVASLIKGGGYHDLVWFAPSVRSYVKQFYLKDEIPFQETELTQFNLR